MVIFLIFQIPSLATLLVFRNAPIIELVLKNNPLRQRYKDHSLYVRYQNLIFL